MTISPAVSAALRTINAAWESGTSYDLASQAAFALEAAGRLQSPESAAELERLRTQVAELEQQATTTRMPAIEDVAAWLRSIGDSGAAYMVSTCDVPMTGQAPATEVSPWQRATDGLNALVDAGIGFHIDPDGHISNPCGDEHIEWDRGAQRWHLVHDEDPGPTAAESADRLRAILAPSPSTPHVKLCGHTDEYGRRCDFRPHTTGNHGRSVGSTLETWPADAVEPAPETGGA